MTTDRDLLADCRARLAFDLLAHTWNAVVLWSLRRLTYNGLVTRVPYAGSPPRVEYELSALGRTLLDPIEAFGAWAYEHGDEVMAAQDRADAHADADTRIGADTDADAHAHPGRHGAP
ncbi:winged helix-turn-helix transcriptional regulator [Streptomyces sp. NPDC059002]|uniref:winged helix-turn-helix transcriptional regulator n=1 Tax=Streptomyces sp. NPDC059002 TaxID=3346690 RepID=UPI0036BDF706